MLCFLLALVPGVPFTGPAIAQESDEDEPLAEVVPAPELQFFYRWIDAFELEFSGTIMLDTAAFSESLPASPDFDDGTEVRRAELELEGELIEGLDFEIEYDFSGSNPDFKDFFLETRHVRAGILKEPFGLEILTESKYSTFTERALSKALNPPRSLGVLYHGWSEGSDLTWAIGAFTERDTFEGSDEFGDTMLTSRVTKRLKHGANAFTHMGLAASLRNSDSDDVLQIKAKPEVHLAPAVVDTGDFLGNNMQIIGIELADVRGPLSFQAEYAQTRIDLIGGPDVTFSGFYAYASYFLTGEERPYDAEEGIFQRLHPLRDYGRTSGGGAWELAARYSHLDLDDGPLRGGVLDEVTLGLNWYVSSHTRAMVNYLHSWLDDAGDLDQLVVRLQFDL